MAVMKDVAKLAGVSISTVSFVLNGMAEERKVAPETAKRFIRAERDLGYQAAQYCAVFSCGFRYGGYGNYYIGY